MPNYYKLLLLKRTALDHACCQLRAWSSIHAQSRSGEQPAGLQCLRSGTSMSSQSLLMSSGSAMSDLNWRSSRTSAL